MTYIDNIDSSFYFLIDLFYSLVRTKLLFYIDYVIMNNIISE